MRKILLGLLLLTALGCKTDVKDYVKWYKSLETYSIPIKNGELIVKEITPEMILINGTEGKISKTLLDSFYKQCNIRQVLFEIKWNSQQLEKQQYGKYVECVVDKRDAIDLIYETSVKEDKGKRIIAVFDSKEFDNGKIIEFAHPEIEKVISIPLNKVKINNKRKLEL